MLHTIKVNDLFLMINLAQVSSLPISKFMNMGGVTIFWGHAFISFTLIVRSHGRCRKSAGFASPTTISLNESENLASLDYFKIYSGNSMRSFYT